MVAFKLVKIDNWDTFEDLCCELWKKIWNDNNVERYGRQGQSQNGVDIVHMSSDGLINAIQCKKVDKLTFKDIDKEICKAKEFNPKLNSLTFATTLDKDVKLHSYILEKSQINVEEGLFEINIKFWEDICQELLKNNDVLKQFYPNFFLEEHTISAILDNIQVEFETFHYSSVENNLKLLKEFFDNFSDENKYKYLILEGRFFLLCNNIEKASKNFLRAFNYYGIDIESKYYKSFGLFLKKEYVGCKEILNHILAEDRFYEKAYDLLLLVNNNLSLSELIKLIPEKLLDSKLINFRLGLIAYEKKEYSAINYLNKSDLENPINSIYLNLIKLDLFYKEQKHLYLDNYDNFVNELIDIEKSLQSKLDMLPNEILKNNLDWIVKLTEINLLLNNNESLNINLEKGLKLDSKNKKLLLNKAKFLMNINKTEEAILILEKLINVYPPSFNILSRILNSQKNYEKIIDYGNILIKNFKDYPERLINCKIIMIDIYLFKNEKEKALELVNSLKNLCNDFYYNLAMSEYYNNDFDKSYQFLNLCKSSMEIANRRDKLVLANKFILSKDLVSAIEIYEDVLDLNYYTIELEFLLECYFDNKDYKKIIDLCETFVSKDEYYPNLLKYLMNIYSMVHDYENLKRISELYLNNFEEDSNIRYNLMRINLIEKNYAEIDSFISEKHDVSTLELEEAIFLYHLCRLRGVSNEILLNLLFDILVENYDKILAHEFYAGEILKNRIEFRDYERVDWDCGVFLKYPNKEEWKFLSKSSSTYPFDTVNETDELSKVLAKNVGDKITVGYNEIEILDVQDKFQYCFRRSISKIEDSGSDYIRLVYFNNPDILKFIFDLIDNHSKKVDQIAQIYKNNSLPIFLFSRILGRDFIDSYYYLLKIGLNSFDENDFRGINKSDKLVIDISSLLTIHFLKIENKVSEHYEFVTSYSTLLILREIFETTKTQVGNGGESVYEYNGNYYRSEINYANKLEFVKKLIKWVEDNCDFIPIYALLDLNPDLRKLIYEIDEQFVTDNILIASKEKFLFLCDDFYVKRIAKEFDVNSLGVLNLIKDSFSNGYMSENEYLSLINNLYMSNFQKFYLKSSNIIFEIKNYNFLFLSKILLNINDFSINIINVLVEVFLEISNECYDENLQKFVKHIILDSLKSDNDYRRYFLFLDVLFSKVNN